MICTFNFMNDGLIEFDDTKSVKELIEHAFNEFDYYEPFGMEIVTIFQCHHSKSDKGWFTLDTSRKCFEEIENRNELCFAYNMPGRFYFAEGGWGKHMMELGNPPYIESPVSLKLRFEEFYNTVVFAGKYSFSDVIFALKSKGYISNNTSYLKIRSVNPYRESYSIPFSSNLMQCN